MFAELLGEFLNSELPFTGQRKLDFPELNFTQSQVKMEGFRDSDDALKLSGLISLTPFLFPQTFHFSTIYSFKRERLARSDYYKRKS